MAKSFVIKGLQVRVWGSVVEYLGFDFDGEGVEC
jgi:hypothetical protein